MKIKQTVLILVSLLGLGSMLVAVPIVSAATCGGVKTSLISCPSEPSKTTDPQKTAIWSLLLVAINILTAAVGVAAVGGVIAASVMYMSAGGSPERTKKANIYLSNTILGIVVYAAMYAFLNFIIPGGLFSP
jgi:hypothetical protein